MSGLKLGHPNLLLEMAPAHIRPTCVALQNSAALRTLSDAASGRRLSMWAMTRPRIALFGKQRLDLFE